MRYITMLLSLALFSAGIAAANPVSISAAEADAMIDGCKAYASENDRVHAIAVYDSGANLVAFSRMDGANVGAVEFALAKAEAVAKWGFSTETMAGIATDVPGFALGPSVATVGGGVPVYSGDGSSFLGAIATSGELPALDVACAEAGIQAAGLKAEPAR